MQADFTDSFNNLTKESSIPTSDICMTSSQDTDGYVKASMIATAAALASGSQYVYTTSNISLTQTIISNDVLLNIAEKVRLAGIDNSTPIPSVVSKFLTCTALSLMTSASLSYWASMYDNYIYPALNAVEFVTSYPGWQNACMEGLAALPQMDAWGYQLNSLLQNVDAGSVMTSIIYTLNQPYVLDRYLFKRINSKDARFYQKRCDNLARNLHIFHLFYWAYTQAASAPAVQQQITNKFKDVLTTAGVSTDASGRPTVTSDVTQMSNRNSDREASLQASSARFKDNQVRLEQMESREKVSWGHKRRAFRALLTWLALTIVVACVLGMEAYRGSPRSLSVLSVLVMSGLGIVWLVAAARSG